MPKIYRLAVLANCQNKSLARQSVSHYTHVTAWSYSDILAFARRIGAVVCGWKVAA